MTVDMTTNYLGLELRNPIIPSASTLSQGAGVARRLQDAGAGALVLQSLFEEQIDHDETQVFRMLETGADSTGEAASYFPELDDYNIGISAYLHHVEALKKELEIPVIASLNGSTDGGWVRHAKHLEDAGADALELNVYFFATEPDVSGADVERRYEDLVASVRGSIDIPLAVKVGPFFSSMANMAVRLVEAGADGLVLFNRFLQPDIDLETLTVDPTLHLSTAEEVRMPLRWIALLRDRLDCSLAATSGVHSWEDAVKLILAGADVTMMASALYLHGPEYLATVLEGLQTWLDERGYESVRQARGSMSQRSVPKAEAFSRANYLRMLTSYSSAFDWRDAPGSPAT